MKIVGLLVVGSGEADRYLPQVLERNSKLFDDLVVAGNNTDSKTEKLCKEYGWFYRDDREWGVHQPNIKTRLLTTIGKLNPTHILPFDGDEVFGTTVTRDTLEGMSRNEGNYFYMVNLWNDEAHYSPNLSFWNVRFFKFDGSRTGYLNKPVHCGLAPPYAYHQGIYQPHLVLHYGLMKQEDRRKKVERYDKYDPNAIHKSRTFYDSLKEQIPGTPFNESDVQRKVEAEVARYGDQTKTKSPEPMSKFYYVKRKKDGATIDIPERDLERTLKTGNFELIGEAITQSAVEAPVVSETNPLQCIICGTVAKSALGLRSHKKSHS